MIEAESFHGLILEGYLIEWFELDRAGLLFIKCIESQDIIDIVEANQGPADELSLRNSCRDSCRGLDEKKQ
jgi:hypothetical protein